MDPISAEEIGGLRSEGVAEHLAPVIETVRRLRTELPDETALLGFCGAPWTVAPHMTAGPGTPDQAPARPFPYHKPAVFHNLHAIFADILPVYMIAQNQPGP